MQVSILFRDSWWLINLIPPETQKKLFVIKKTVNFYTIVKQKTDVDMQQNEDFSLTQKQHFPGFGKYLLKQSPKATKDSSNEDFRK